MCGIAGVIAWDDRYRVSHETLRRMSARIAHRGPDGEGYYLNHEQEVTPNRPQCGFAFRRLAILDPDPRAMQPFTIGDKTIVFNGEIYNFRELRAELSTLRPEYQWRTTGDTEVLLLAHDAWGEKCLERLNGMFAFAVWDEREKSLFLARDRMGQKPLYVSERPGRIVFGSELPAVMASGVVDSAVSQPALIEYLRWGYNFAPTTIYVHVTQLWPGTWRSVPGTHGNKYFTPNRKLTNLTRTPSRIKGAVATAVNRQLVSDVPLGCFLSGGTDSSIIAAAAMKSPSLGERLRTFSIGFEDPRYDETRFAQQVAAHLGTNHRSFIVRADALQDLPTLARAFGEPFADSSAIPTHHLSKEVRAHVKVALSGDGGDELFGGYDRYRAMNLERRLARVPQVVRTAIAAQGKARLAAGHPKSFRLRVARFLRSVDLTPADRYASYLRLFDDDALVELFSLPPSHRMGDGPMPRLIKKHLMMRGADAVEAALAVDRITYLPGDLLTKVDRASMLHALEVRSPFMDHELVQFAAGLTTDQLLKGGPKRMLREAFADDLPAWVFKRKKMGFAVPIGEWFRGELRPMLRDHLFASDSFARQHFNMKVVERLVDEHETQKVDHSQRLYALLMLELWWRNVRG